MSIFININQQQAGPYEIGQVNQMLKNGQISHENLAWLEGMANWEPLNSPTFSSKGISIANSTETEPNIPIPEQEIPAGGGSISIGTAIGDAFGFFKQNVLGCLAWLILHPILGATGIGSFLIPLIGVNLFICAKRFQETGKKMDLGDLFNFDKALEKIFGPIILGIIIGIGFLILIIPGIIFSMWWTFSACVLADRPDLSFTDAMKASRNVAKGNWISLILLFVVIGLLQVLGMICLGFGLFVTIPVGHLALYYAYKQAKG